MVMVNFLYIEQYVSRIDKFFYQQMGPMPISWRFWFFSEKFRIYSYVNISITGNTQTQTIHKENVKNWPLMVCISPLAILLAFTKINFLLNLKLFQQTTSYRPPPWFFRVHSFTVLSLLAVIIDDSLSNA
jgi:hypothetical protein